MKTPRIGGWCVLIVVALVQSGCVTVPPKDYSALRASHPRSILILPPVNESTEIGASYSLLTTLTRPLAELGYYVMPVVLVDQFLKENGLTVPDEMQRAPLDKLYEAFGAEAVLYITIEKFGSKYMLIAASTIVYARAKLVDSRTGVTLWENRVQFNGGGQSGLVEALVTQVLNKLTDQSHQAAMMASYQLFIMPPGQGLLTGPRHPEYGRDRPAR